MWSNISAAIKYLCSVVEDGNTDDVAAVFGNAKISAILDDFSEKEIIEGVWRLMKRMHAPSQGDVYQKILTGRNAVVMYVADGTVSLIMPTSIEIYELSDLRKRFVFTGKNVDLSALMGVLDDEDVPEHALIYKLCRQYNSGKAETSSVKYAFQQLDESDYFYVLSSFIIDGKTCQIILDRGDDPVWNDPGDGKCLSLFSDGKCVLDHYRFKGNDITQEIYDIFEKTIKNLYGGVISA